MSRLNSVAAVLLLASTAGIASAAMDRTAINFAERKDAQAAYTIPGSVPTQTGNATRATVSVDLTGFTTYDGGFPGALNSRQTLNLAPNAQITGVSFSNLSIQLSNGSYGEEFTISTNISSNPGTAGTFWDYRPFPDALGTPTTLGPVSGAFTSPSNAYNSGPFTLLADGQLFLYVYEQFNDAGASVDATVLSGTLTITYSVVPEPASLSLIALGGLALRRRRA